MRKYWGSMNYLGHLRLSEDNPYQRIGQLAGDVVKGRDLSYLHPEVAAGVRAHRRIDVLCDQYYREQQLRDCFPLALQRYAGILCDLGVDYLLATEASWPEGFPQFCHRVAMDLQQYHHAWPKAFLPLGERLQQPTALQAWAQWETVNKALWRLDQRLRRPSPLPGAGPALFEALPQLCDALPGLLLHINNEALTPS